MDEVGAVAVRAGAGDVSARAQRGSAPPKSHGTATVSRQSTARNIAIDGMGWR